MLSETALLTEIALVLLAALGVLVAADELGLSPIPGWLLAGMLLGPGAAGWLRDPLLQAALLQGCGAVLLFIVGVELRRRRPAGRRPRGVLVGIAHTLAVTGGIAGVLLAQGLDWRDGAFTATTLTLGCGALILPIAVQHPALSGGAGELTDGIFRAHVGATVLAAVLPALLGGGWSGAGGDRWVLAAGATALGLAGVARWRRSRRPVAAGAGALVLAALSAVVVWLAATLGAGLLVGALVAGLLAGKLEGRPAGLQATLRLRGPCSAGFFLMLGAQIDLHILAQHAGLVLTLVASGLGATLLATLAGGALLRAPPRSAVLAGVLLAPTGTLSLALAESGQRVGVLPLGGMAGGEQVLLAAAAPLLLIAPLLLRQPRPRPAAGAPLSGTAAPPAAAVLLVGEGALSEALAARVREGGIPLHHVALDGPAPPPQLRHALRALERLDPAAGAALVLTTGDLLAAQVLLIRARRQLPGLPAMALAGDARARAFLELLGAEPAVRDDPAGHEQLLAALLAQVVRGAAWGGGPALTLAEPDARGRERWLVAVAPGAPAAGQPLGALGLERGYGVRLLAIYQGGRGRIVPGHRQRVWPGDVLVLEGQAQQLAALTAAVFQRPG